MLTRTAEYDAIARDALGKTAIPKLLAQRPAVILERRARGGGATDWYYCPDIEALDAVSSHLCPGSCVSFYFDDRIEVRLLGSNVVDHADDVFQRTGEAVIGWVPGGTVKIRAMLCGTADEATEFFSEAENGSLTFVGVFPARDNDGVRAVTLDLPDADGIMRRHPH